MQHFITRVQIALKCSNPLCTKQNWQAVVPVSHHACPSQLQTHATYLQTTQPAIKIEHSNTLPAFTLSPYTNTCCSSYHQAQATEPALHSSGPCKWRAGQRREEETTSGKKKRWKARPGHIEERNEGIGLAGFTRKERRKERRAKEERD